LKEAVEILFLSLALGMDAFSVALGAGMVVAGWRPALRLSWHFGFFQFLMPLVGWQAARVLSPSIGAFGGWLGAALLFLIGIRMIGEGLRKRGDGAREDGRIDPTRGWSLVGLSVATSIDALGVGFGFGLVRSHLFRACVVIGATALVMTWLGVRLGTVLGKRFGSAAEVLGGAVLVLLGFRLLLF